MAVHLLAYSGAVATVADTSLAGLVDPVVTRSQTSNLYILQQRLMLLAAVGMSATLNRVKLSSPTLRQINQPYIRPIIAAARPRTNDQISYWADQPLMLPALEEIGPLVTSDVNPGPETAFFLAWVADSLIPVPSGPIITARFTATTAAVAATWTLMNITMEQPLPTGAYMLVGSEHYSTTAIAHRWSIFNQVFRPGSLSHQLTGDIQDWRLLNRRLGAYGQFNNTSIPQLEVLCTTTDAAHTGFMQLVPLSGQIAP